MQYTDLVFDLYGTLVDIHTEESDAVWEKTAVFLTLSGAEFSGPELKTAFLAAMSEFEAGEGRSYECFPDIPFEWAMNRLLKEKAVSDREGLASASARIFRLLSLDYIRLYPNVKRALTRLREQGYRLWLLSNAQRAFIDFELPHLGLTEFFDGVYISSDYRCRKPDPRFYAALTDERGLIPERCIMIGNDRRTDIAGAAACGMSTLYMHTALTPVEQAAADPAAGLSLAENTPAHWEYEGSDWDELADFLCSLRQTDDTAMPGED